MPSIEGIINEPNTNFVGKDGFFWWVGEVEDNEDPMELGRVKVRVLGYYTNVRGGTTADLPTENLPWATVLQHTCQSGNDGQGESSGQLQPGAIVMGFFMDGESAQMPIVIGVMRVKKSAESQKEKIFAFTGEHMEPGVGSNVAAQLPGSPNSSTGRNQAEGYGRANIANTVDLPNQKGENQSAAISGVGSPNNIGTVMNGSSGNPIKPRSSNKPNPAANGVGGPWKTLEYKLSYLIEDLADHAGSLIRAEDGDFLDVVTGKLVTAKQLTVKLQNFLSSVFAQVVAAMRQALANLAEQLELINILGGATGVPFVVFAAIQAAVKTILASLCNVDSRLLSFISDPVGSIVGILENFLDGVIDKATMVMQGVQAAIDGVICQVQRLLDQVLGVVDTVSAIVDGIGKAKEIIEAWKAGSEIFESGTDLLKKGINSITGLIQLFIKFAASNCDRKPDGGKDTVGWYPLFGVTHCTPEELAEINAIRGQSRGTCGGDAGSGSLFDNIFNEADPYLTAAKTFLDGSYDLFVGTPGRQASVHKKASGTTSTSVKINQNEYAKFNARKEIRKQKPDISEEELEKQVDVYVKDQNKSSSSGKGDTGSLVADHCSFAGNYTEETHGDQCKQIDGDHVVNVDGDYFLKITGDCHIEVGGGFFFDAEGAPKVVDKKGNKKNEKVQKHTIKFGSDVDINTVGAKFEVQGAEFNVGSVSTKFTSSVFESSGGQMALSAGEMIISGDNSIDIITPSLVEMINVPVSKMPKVMSGIRRMVGGSVETVMIPGSGTDSIPRYTIANPLGPYSLTCGTTGYNCNVITGAYNANVAAGFIYMQASAAVTMLAGAGMLLEAGAAVLILGKTVFIN
tara:strand:- start:486 stop:3047 length:2562 start_codon:yes stop_codon:yes gene_type:complete